MPAGFRHYLVGKNFTDIFLLWYRLYTFCQSVNDHRDIVLD